LEWKGEKGSINKWKLQNEVKTSHGYKANAFKNKKPPYRTSYGIP